MKRKGLEEPYYERKGAKLTRPISPVTLSTLAKNDKRAGPRGDSNTVGSSAGPEVTTDVVEG